MLSRAAAAPFRGCGLRTQQSLILRLATRVLKPSTALAGRVLNPLPSGCLVQQDSGFIALIR